MINFKTGKVSKNGLFCQVRIWYNANKNVKDSKRGYIYEMVR